ncbi:MAG: hypothetical protein GY862_39290, partial [Gammaproteobacteria bacterium]|nr:hypothetical protein [Gammaproteobacteria bacterium]
MIYRAFIEKLGGDYLALMRRGLEHIKFGENLPDNARIFIKPNLTFPHYRPGVMTSPQAVEAAILAIRE